MSDLDDVVKEFLVESHEGLDRLDRDLVALEQRPHDQELLAGIFRCIHTVKGTCGFLGFTKLESVSHVGESLLSLMRDGKLELTPEITSALLQLVDAVRQILRNIETDQTEGDVEYASLVEWLTWLQTPEATTPVAAPPGASPIAVAVAPAPEPVPAPPVIERRTAERRQESRREGDHLPPAESESHGVSASDSSIRVDVGLLDRLMNLVGELVLTRNQILQLSTGTEDSALQATSQRLNLITSELQEGVMKTRMQPIGNIWSRFPRVVRDLAVACAKQVRVEMEGGDTELDKTIIEAIKDPLTHVIRNSVDHGIESPAVRLAAGKPSAGCLVLRAYHEGGQVNIEISDDGGGINVGRVKQKAVERGVITPDQAARMSEREALLLIFLPGFSTAERVTNVSGRGVGMDVVRTNIEKIGGTVDVQSKLGESTTIKIKIPLTLAIIPALLIGAGGDQYAIPQVNLLELVRLEGEDARAGIETMYGTPVYRLRGNLLPLAYLNRVLGLPAEIRAGEDPDVVNIVVLQADEHQFGLVVDRISDTEEIVVKPLSKQIKEIAAFAGATIMGDGRVALILDVMGVARLSGIVSNVRDRTRTETATPAEQGGPARQTMLVFGLGTDRRLAIPLSIVSRLEEFPATLVERAGSGQVVQYRGEIMPLIHLSAVLDGGEAVFRDPLQVVVYSDGSRSRGLVVDNILDIVEETLTVQRRSGNGVVYGSAVIQQRVTDLLDVEAIVGDRVAVEA
jgi:two-component system chemotaxis sensor kinase CheA